MSYKVKSSLYFASFMLALVTYYTIATHDNVLDTELAHHTIEQISTDNTLH